MQSFSLLPQELVFSVWRHRNLIATLAKREVVGRYQGATFGILWSFFHPVFMLAVYTFVFSVVFKTRWGTGGDSKAEFALVLFAGLIVFNLFTECINRAPSLVINNANYVKKVIFPLEILPWVSMASALFHALVSVGVWSIFFLIFLGIPKVTVFLLPLVLLPLLFFTMGLSWLLASLGVYLRDVAQVIGVITTVLMFLSPIFYPVSALPLEYQSLLLLNPITPVIEQVRDVLIWGNVPDWGLFIRNLFISLVIAWLGFGWFQKTRKGFADVL